MAKLYRTNGKKNGKPFTYPIWRGRYKDQNGNWRCVSLFKDKTASQRKLDDLQRDADQRAAGVITPLMDHAAKAIAEHEADYLLDLRGQNLSPMHIKNVTTRLNEVVTTGKWSQLRDITAESMRVILSHVSQRKAQGYKKDQLLATSTVNSFLRVARGFVHWLIEQGRMLTDPLRAVKRADERRAAKKRERRAATTAELAALLAVAPPHRGFIYLFASLTGLRRKEMRYLIVGDLRLDAAQPFIQLRTGQTKNKRDDQIPLHPELLPGLVELVKGRSAGQPVFKAIPEVRTLEQDLRKANVEFVDGLGCRLDIHAFRHTFGTLVALSGASMKVAHQLMRHGDPELTMNVYAHAGISDTAAALAKVQMRPDMPSSHFANMRQSSFPNGPVPSQLVACRCTVDVGHSTIATDVRQMKYGNTVINVHGSSLHVLRPGSNADIVEISGPHSSVG